jgi:mono/diheme cytochrome c family protein
VRAGRGGMPSYKKILSEKEVAAVARFVIERMDAW